MYSMSLFLNVNSEEHQGQKQDCYERLKNVKMMANLHFSSSSVSHGTKQGLISVSSEVSGSAEDIVSH